MRAKKNGGRNRGKISHKKRREREKGRRRERGGKKKREGKEVEKRDGKGNTHKREEGKRRRFRVKPFIMRFSLLTGRGGRLSAPWLKIGGKPLTIEGEILMLPCPPSVQIMEGPLL